MTVYPDPNRCPPCTIITKEGYTILDIGDWPGYIDYANLITREDTIKFLREFTNEDVEQFFEENRELIDRLANSVFEGR